jgi:hypothetical protein
MTYRTGSETVREVYDWDIVTFHGLVRVIGMTLSHVDCARQYSGECRCNDHPVVSSPVVCPNTRRRLEEAWYDGDELTGDARFLLDAKAGDEILVGSGKLYRLVGERKEKGHDSYARGSIWRVYAEPTPEPPEPQLTWWDRLMSFLFQGAAA